MYNFLNNNFITGGKFKVLFLTCQGHLTEFILQLLKFNFWLHRKNCQRVDQQDYG